MHTVDARPIPTQTTAPSPVLFFDGVCGLCNGFVQLVLKADRKGVFKVATLQGSVAAEKLPAELLSKHNTTVVWKGDGQILTKSRAVLFVISRLGGMFRLLSALGYLFPRVLADAVYDLVAKYRFRIFGRPETCRIPTPEERARFLD